LAATLEKSGVVGGFSFLCRRWPKQQITNIVRMMPTARPEKKPTRMPGAGYWLQWACVAAAWGVAEWLAVLLALAAEVAD